MKRELIAVVSVVALACAAAAQEPKQSSYSGAIKDPELVQPPKAGNLAAQRAEAAKRLAEEVESLEAHLHTKKAYIQAAVVAVKAADLTLDRVSKAGNPAALDETKLAMEAAKAHLMIREAEANEVMVKLKHAKRRVEENQKAELQGDFRLKLQLLEVQAALRLAQAELNLAETELKRLEELAKRGIVAPAEYDAARAKQDVAKAQVEVLARQLETLKMSAKP